MLSDFLTLEAYFGSESAALYFEELSQKYNTGRIWEAVQRGDLHCREIRLGPEKGRWIYWLSEKGRGKALSEATTH